jgi:hypothetical protein
MGPTSTQPVRTTAQILDETIALRLDMAAQMPQQERSRALRELRKLRRGARLRKIG